MKVSTVHFNLKFFNADGGEEVVRSLDDLATKFNLSDLYDYFKAGDLSRWLMSINMSELSDAVEKAKSNVDLRKQIYGLCDVLALPVDKTGIEQFISLLERQDKLREKKNISDAKSDKSYSDKSYIELVNDVFDAKDFKVIKDRLAVLRENMEYEERFLRDVICGVDVVDIKALLAIFGHEQWRKYLHHISSIRLLYRACGGAVVADINDDCLSVFSVKDQMIIASYSSCLKISELDGNLLKRCIGESSPRGRFRKGGTPYGGEAGLYRIYDDRGNPVGKLGTVIDEYISW